MKTNAFLRCGCDECLDAKFYKHKAIILIYFIKTFFVDFLPLTPHSEAICLYYNSNNYSIQTY